MTLSCLSPRQSYKVGNVVALLTQRKGAEVQSGYTERGEMAALHLLWISPDLKVETSSLPAYCSHETESESCSVVSNSVTPWNNNNNNASLLVLGILQTRILEWVAIPFSRGSSQARDWTQVSHTAGRFFTSWATREAHEYWSGWPIPSPADLPDPGIKLGSPALQADSLPTELRGKPMLTDLHITECLYKRANLSTILLKYQLKIIQLIPISLKINCKFFCFLFSFLTILSLTFMVWFRLTPSFPSLFMPTLPFKLAFLQGSASFPLSYLRFASFPTLAGFCSPSTLNADSASLGHLPDNTCVSCLSSHCVPTAPWACLQLSLPTDFSSHLLDEKTLKSRGSCSSAAFPTTQCLAPCNSQSRRSWTKSLRKPERVNTC